MMSKYIRQYCVVSESSTPFLLFLTEFHAMLLLFLRVQCHILFVSESAQRQKRHYQTACLTCLRSVCFYNLCITFHVLCF